MTKLLITESQLKRLIELNKNSINELPVLEEGFKDIVLGIALLTGVGLTGQNKIQAQSALDDKTTLNKIANVLQSDELKNVIDSLESAGMINPEEKIKQNADKITSELSQKGIKVDLSKSLKIKEKKEVKAKANNYKELAKKLKQGYAITNISQDTIKAIANEVGSNIQVIDSIETPTYDLSELFNPGNFIISNEAKTELKSILDQLKEQDYIIVGIRITSSTDKQRLSANLSQRLKDLSYPEGNEGLSKIRNDQIKKALMNLGVNDSLIKQTIKYNEGLGELNAVLPQDPLARYIQLQIDVIKIQDDITKAKVKTEEDVIKSNFELVKLLDVNNKFNLKLPHITFKSKKGNGQFFKRTINDSPTFN
jgi:signal recognition particle subunit SEC65